MVLIEKFIKKNNLDFEVGERNSDCTVLAGYALHALGDTLENTEDIIKIIGVIHPVTTLNEEVAIEFRRVMTYAYLNNYGDFWKSDVAKKMYTY